MTSVSVHERWFIFHRNVAHRTMTQSSTGTVYLVGRLLSRVRKSEPGFSWQKECDFLLGLLTLPERGKQQARLQQRLTPAAVLFFFLTAQHYRVTPECKSILVNSRWNVNYEKDKYLKENNCGGGGSNFKKITKCEMSITYWTRMCEVEKSRRYVWYLGITKITFRKVVLGLSDARILVSILSMIPTSMYCTPRERLLLHSSRNS